MNRITEFFMKRPVLFWSFVCIIVFAGIIAFRQMPKLEDPEVTVKQAMVVVSYPGATAHEMELQVAQLMEDELRNLPDVRSIRTECTNGMAMITVEFKMTVLLEDLEQHFDLLRRKANDAAMLLPQGCSEPIVIDDLMDSYGIFYSLTGDGYEYSELYKYAKYIRRELLGVSGVKRVTIAGNRDEVINITLSKEQISRNGIMPTQIMSALSSAGSSVDAGDFLADNERYAVHVDSAVKDEDDIRNLMIQTLDGKQLRIGDIATVERTYSEPQRNGFFVNGEPALAIGVSMEADAIVPDVGKAVDARLAEIMENIPAGMVTDKIYFQPDKVSNAISSFMLNLLESVLIVILVLILTMGIRSGIIIGFGLVLTVCVSFPILLSLGTTLQRISLGAFIVAMGMLVDNAVVIMDGILVDKQRGLGPKTYLYRIGRNTAMPLLGATIIAASAFICVYLSPDTAGEYAGDLFLVLCVSLLSSWFLALVQVPICSKSWLPARPVTKPGEQAQVMNSPVHRFVRRAITVLIGHKAITISVAVVVLAVCGLGFTKVKNLFFPDFDYKQFVVECFFPSASDPEMVRDNLLEMSDMLLENPEIDRVAISQGGPPFRYCLVRPMTSGGDCYGELIMDCKDYKTVVKNIPDVRKQLREAYPEAYIRVRKYNFSINTTHTIEVEFGGPDPAVLRDLSAQAEEIMRNCKYVDPYSVQNNWKPMGKTLVAEYVQQDALRSGIGRSDIGNALQAAGDGMTIGVINDQERMILLNLLVRNEDGSRIADINDIPVWSMMNLHLSEEDMTGVLTGGTGMDELQDKVFSAMPLSNVTSDIRLEWDEDLIRRLNGRRVIEAECDPAFDSDKATAALAMSTMEKDLLSIPLPEGYTIRWVGDEDTSGEAIDNMFKNIPVTIAIILIVLLLLFGNWKKLILVLICFPFVLCGIVPALLLTGQPFTFMALVGVFGLSGMMIKNSIVLVDEIGRLETEEKAAPFTAIVEATVSRVRPVLMASFTTIGGMIPLVPDPMYGAMAIAIMGGLAVGTIITLVLLPVFYAAFFHVRKPSEN